MILDTNAVSGFLAEDAALFAMLLWHGIQSDADSLSHQIHGAAQGISGKLTMEN